MNKKSEAYNLMSKKEFELDEKMRELVQAKDQYRQALISETIDDILTVLKEDGELTERDLKIFLGELSVRTKQLYSK